MTLFRNTRGFFSICKPYGDRIKVVILETPYYSIKLYNKYLGTTDRSASDSVVTRKLKKKIDLLNEEIYSLNESNNVRVPKFKKDLIKTRKSNKKRKIETVSYSLFKDGLHPKPLLSRYWQRSDNTILADYCY